MKSNSLMFRLDWMIKGIAYLCNQKPSESTCAVARVKDMPVTSCSGILFPVPSHTIQIFSHAALFIKSVEVQDLSSIFLISSCLTRHPFSQPSHRQPSQWTHRASGFIAFHCTPMWVPRLWITVQKNPPPPKSPRWDSCRALCNLLNSLGDVDVYYPVQLNIQRQCSPPIPSKFG